MKRSQVQLGKNVKFKIITLEAVINYFNNPEPKKVTLLQPKINREFLKSKTIKDPSKDLRKSVSNQSAASKASAQSANF